MFEITVLKLYLPKTSRLYLGSFGPDQKENDLFSHGSLIFNIKPKDTKQITAFMKCILLQNMGNNAVCCGKYA